MYGLFAWRQQTFMTFDELYTKQPADHLSSRPEGGTPRRERNYFILRNEYVISSGVSQPWVSKRTANENKR